MTSPPESTTFDPEPKWKELSLRTLRASATEVLGREPIKRTMRGAYEELYLWLTRESGRELAFTCQVCESLIDDQMPKCWACGGVLSDDAGEDPIADSELNERAEKLGLGTDGKSREEVTSAIEDAETKKRRTKQNVDLLGIESARLNEILTQDMPDGWRKTRSKQYTSYFDSNGSRRFAIWNSGLKVYFSVDNGFLDGFPDIEFFDAEERRKRHHGRTNYLFSGESSKVAVQLVRRVFEKYAT